jgi:glutamate-1-semialdehyde 2,1-aminomutase
MDEHGDDIAAILVEPIAGNMGYIPPVDGFLEGLRRICDAHGSLLVFDEVMTGFRVAWGGYQVTTGIEPDLTCLGKVIGGGMPVAAYAGRRQLMEQVSPLGPVYQAGTLSGNPIGMACGLATLNLCRATGFYETLGQSADRLADGLKRAADEAGVPVQTGSTGGMLGLAFAGKPVRNYDDARASDHERFARFFRAMLERGVWLPPSGYEAMFISVTHTDAILDEVIDAARESFKAVAS